MRFTSAMYAYLLGMYLGDGCIQRLSRTYSLRFSLDRKYPGIVEEVRRTLSECLPENPISLHAAGPRRTATVLCVYGNHLPCLFPQHGAGKKQDRPILLEPWQADHVTEAPWMLLRGLIQSDGCRFINRTGRYAYPSYDFTQFSDDIRELFVRTCESVNVKCRPYARRVRVYDRSSVELMDRHIGGKF